MAWQRRQYAADAGPIRAALDNDQVKQIAAHFGVPVDKALELLSASLPQIVDQASPNGKLQ